MPCRSKSLTAVPRLALTPRPPLLKHSAQYSPPLKRIITTVTMPRPYKTIVLSRFLSAIAHHALKSPDSLSKRNSKRSRKIVTAPCRAKKLEKCHVKHFPLIITQALRPHLPRRSRPSQENRQQRRQRLFSCSPIVGAVHAATSSLLRFTPLQAIPCATTTASGCRDQKPPRSYRNTSKFGKAINTADTAHSIEKRDYKQHARDITRSQTKSITAL